MSFPPQTGYRWASVTPVDHSGTLYIVAFLSLTYSSLTFLTRIFIRRHMLGLDDGAMLAAQFTSIIQFALLLISLSTGLAKSFNIINDDQYSRMASTLSANQVTMYISLGFSKIATILLVRRLFIRDMKNTWRICNVITGAILIWTILSALLVSAGCSAESISPKTPSQICSGIEKRYMFVVVTDAMTDLVLAFIPVYLCRRLQMNILLKLQVLGIFALRLPLLVLAGYFLKTWKRSLHSGNPGIARTVPLVFQQSQLCFSLITGSIPCLKSFIRSFDTGSGVKVELRYTSGSGENRRWYNLDYNNIAQGTKGENYELTQTYHDDNRMSRIRKKTNGERVVRLD